MTRASDTARLVSGGAVINEASNDVDFRVESNGDTHALFVDAGNDSLGLFTDTTSTAYHKVNVGLTGTVISGNTDGATITSDAIFKLADDTNWTSTDSTIFLMGGGEGGSVTGQISSAIGFARESNTHWGTQLKFYTHPADTSDLDQLTERMRMDASGRLLIGATTYDASNAGIYLNGASGKGFFTVSGDAPLAINRLSSDGDLVELRQANNTEGTISVSGSTVSYNGFSGQHESSGIATNTPIGTVVSTIDELDTYPTGTTKAGQTRADHAKVEVSDTVGDSAVYGVVSRFDDNDKVFVASVGIGSVRVTGACAKGDLLESNGDGTAKVQSDDIVRSKTIGKVTIGNSNSGVKLVSCVLYCG